MLMRPCCLSGGHRWGRCAASHAPYLGVHIFAAGVLQGDAEVELGLLNAAWAVAVKEVRAVE